MKSFLKSTSIFTALMMSIGFLSIARAQESTACKTAEKEIKTIEMETGQVCYFEFSKPVTNLYGGITQLADVAIVTNRKVVFTAKRTGTVDILGMANGEGVERVRVQINLPPPAPNIITQAEGVVTVKKMTSSGNKVEEVYQACSTYSCRPLSSNDVQRHQRDTRTINLMQKQ